MYWLKKKVEPQLAAIDGDAALEKNGRSQLDATHCVMPVRVARKPSERFMRRPLEAKSRASQSERFTLASLKEKLNFKAGETTNESTVFNGYCPGREKLPG